MKSSRDQCDDLLSRIELLEGNDRVIMELYFRRGATLRNIACLMNVSPSTIGRKIGKICSRLYGLSRIERIPEHIRTISNDEFEIALDRYARGYSYRKISSKYGMSLQKVKNICRRIELSITLANLIHSDSRLLKGGSQ